MLRGPGLHHRRAIGSVVAYALLALAAFVIVAYIASVLSTPLAAAADVNVSHVEIVYCGTVVTVRNYGPRVVYVDYVWAGGTVYVGRSVPPGGEIDVNTTVAYPAVAVAGVGLDAAAAANQCLT